MSGGMRLARCEPVMGEAARVVGVEEAEVLGFALRAMADGVAIVERSGRIRFVNRALAEAWGVPVPAILGRLAGDFVRLPGSPASLDTVLAAAVRGSWRGDLGRSGPDSPRGIWEVTFSRIGETDTLVGVFRDCSERQALDQLRADFLSMITHDIKTPLTVILGYTELLTEAESRPADMPPDILAHIRESGEKIHTLVSNFLDVSRIEAGRLVLDRRVIDLAGVVAQAVDQLAWSARRKGLALSVESGTLPAGGAVRVTTGRHNGHVTVAVRDTGRGIPAHELPHLFEKYRRVRDKNRTEGTGLGLFIAKTIVEAHGGQIRVESAPGAGSTFTVLLPA
ncbi:MAG: PAS domain-containing protein [Deltaproteobacteria bacterium]|nr:MAG: PAS domain-containing protein [Deltaproteobacteria bacterium]